MSLLSTARLELREFSESDLVAVHVFASDPEVSRLSAWGPNSLDETSAWLNKVLRLRWEVPRLVYELAICRKGEGAPLGTCRIAIVSAGHREAELGYTLRKDEWGKGYATEAARVLVEFGFEALKMQRIWATTSPENHASHRVLEKAGLRREGLLKAHKLVRGAWRDSVVYAIVKSRFLVHARAQ